MNKKILATVLAIAALMAAPAQAEAASSKSTQILIEGGWTGLGETAAEAKSGCYAGQYSKLDAGTRVKVTSGSGKILATGSLKWRVLEVVDQALEDESYYEEYSSIRFQATCQLYSKLSLPYSTFYQFRFGSVDGGSYSNKEMTSKKWLLALTFG
jgi:hypothetical protein